jgi:serine/threonine-protein kinase
MTPEDALRAVAATLARFGTAETALVGLSRTVARASSPVGEVWPLPKIPLDLSTTSSAESTGADLVARGELGRGGMGVVHLVEQRSLGREVAVKTVRTADASAARALIREARVMGSLEHPNLVPVHAVGIDSAGEPILVMKRIEGVSWRQLLAEDAHLAWTPLLAGHGDRLRAHVEILTQLCRALAFAHEHGVVHRDLKPENVMVGRHGEVYLVDWGLALRLSEREVEAPGIVGTPGYLAPEMVQGDPHLVDQRTDVYLLGGVLYEVLTGRMPHAAPTPLAALVLSLTGEIAPLPEDAPSDLANLVRRAMALSSEDRLASAEAFREGLQRFLASREVDRAVAEARAALARARAEIAKDGPESLQAFRALIEARVTLVGARRARPRDEAIQADLDACVRHLVDRELALRSAAGARSMLAELTVPSAALEAKLAALEQELAAERAAAAEQRAQRREADTSIALEAMKRLALLSAAVIAVGLAWFSWEVEIQGRGPPPKELLIVLPSAVLAASLIAIAVGRRTLLATAASRRMVAFVLVIGVVYLINNAVAVFVDSPMNVLVSYLFVSMAAVCAMGAVTVQRALWSASAVYLVGLGAVFIAPEWSISISIPVTAGYLASCWRAMSMEAERTRAGAATRA